MLRLSVFLALLIFIPLVGLKAFTERPLWKRTETIRSTPIEKVPEFRLVGGLLVRHGKEITQKLSFSSPALQPLLRQKPEVLRVSVPILGKASTLLLVATDPGPSPIDIQTGSGERIDWKPGLYYQGVIEQRPNSLVALSFFEDQVLGLVSDPQFGDWSIGPKKGSREHVIRQKNPERSSQKCQISNEDFPDLKTIQSTVSPATQTTTDKVIRIYYEIGNDVFQGCGNSMAQTLNWLSALHHGTKTVFFNEGIQVTWNATRVWNTLPPFQYDLESFRNYRSSFNGDVAALITWQGGGGVANGIGRICSASHENGLGFGPYQISNVEQTLDSLPNYSLTLYIVCHEFGHLLGSQHTHDCVWNGNNTQIDDCGNVNNPMGNTPPCFDTLNPILPALFEGTIMSYCAGSLAAGFGPQPAERMRQRINAVSCLSTDGQYSCTKTLDSVQVLNVSYTQASFRLFDADSSANRWLRRITNWGVPVSDWDTISTREFAATGLLPNQDGYKVEVKQICKAPFVGDFQVRKSFTSPWTYCGSVFKDDGGDDTYVGLNQTYVIRPMDSTQRVRLTFTMCLLSPEDSLIFYNGPSISGNPIAMYSGFMTNVPPVVSTHPSGALTVAFRGDNSYFTTNLGWVAQISCDAVTRIEPIESPLIRLFPNPAQEMLHIRDGKSDRYWIWDLRGTLVKTQQADPEARETRLVLAGLPAGTYSIRGRNWAKPIRFIKK